MSIFSVLFLMILFHVIDDFYLQGVLAQMKQRDWWRKHTPGDMYRFDYVAALIVHAVSWSIMVTLPIFFATAFNPPSWMYLFILVNAVIHAVVDHAKANRRVINLVDDQSIHLVQVLFEWFCYGLWVLFN